MKLRFWYKVHGKKNIIPSADAMLDAIRPRVPGLTYAGELFDNGGWQPGGLCFMMESSPIITVGRLVPGDPSYLQDRPDWEAELRTWKGPDSDGVIQHLHAAQQTITITPVPLSLGSTRHARICEQLCGYVAQVSEGLIHVDQSGFFNAEGESIFPCSPKHRLKIR